jgi:hypothetical protein
MTWLTVARRSLNPVSAGIEADHHLEPPAPSTHGAAGSGLPGALLMMSAASTAFRCVQVDPCDRNGTLRVPTVSVDYRRVERGASVSDVLSDPFHLQKFSDHSGLVMLRPVGGILHKMKRGVLEQTSYFCGK